MLRPDTARLLDFALDMRLIVQDEVGRHPWWIRQMRDNGGRVVATRAWPAAFTLRTPAGRDMQPPQLGGADRQAAASRSLVHGELP